MVNFIKKSVIVLISIIFVTTIASASSRVDLTDNFDLDINIRNHMTQLRATWDPIINTKDSKNYLKVGLYAYDQDTEILDYYEDPNLYVSGWKCKHKQNTAYTLGKVYQSEDYGSIKKNDKKLLIKDFNQRGIVISSDKEFPYQTYAHSEQTHISYLQRRKENNEINDEIYDSKNDSYNYNNFLMFYYSKNEMCISCNGAMSRILEEDNFGDLVSYYQGNKVTLNKRNKKGFVPIKIDTNNENTFNIFYLALNRQYDVSDKIDFSSGSNIYHTYNL
jgi:hypothetical protein